MSDVPAPQPESPSGPAAVWALRLLGLLGIVAAGAGVLLLAHHKANAEARDVEVRHAVVAAGPLVRVAPVTLSPADRTLTLPAEARAFSQTTLYAKVSGYLKEIRVDKGQEVKAGQLIGILESPDLDQQVAAAEADLSVKKLLATRNAELLKTGIVSQQDAENASAAAKVAAATVERARAMRSYLEIRAPFDGVVTARYVDQGALLPAATGSTQSAQPVVDVAHMDRLRVVIYLGQDDATWVKVGDPVLLSADGRPSDRIKARISRITRTLDPRTRTMLCEADVDNRAGRLYPGEFLHASIGLKGDPFPMVPAEAIISRADKLFVASIADSHAHLMPIETGFDDGQRVQITAGLHGGEIVALGAAGDLFEGAAVQVVQPEAKAAR